MKHDTTLWMPDGDEEFSLTVKDADGMPVLQAGGAVMYYVGAMQLLKRAHYAADRAGEFVSEGRADEVLDRQINDAFRNLRALLSSALETHLAIESKERPCP